MRIVKLKDEIIRFLTEKGGYFRRRDLKSAGYDPQWVYRLENDGIVERIGWGVYKLVSGQQAELSSFVEISAFIPNGVVCLRSALEYYQLTNYNPPVIDVAISRIPHRTPRIENPPVKFWVFSAKFFSLGIKKEIIDGREVKFYDREKTICDCFRLRNKVGFDIAKEGLQEYLKLKDRDIPKLLKYADICRVKAVMRPYLDAML